MRACPESCQYEDFITHHVEQKPIRSHMTLADASIIP